MNECWEVRSISSLRSIALGSEGGTAPPTPGGSAPPKVPRAPLVLPQLHFIELWKLLHELVQAQPPPQDMELQEEVVKVGEWDYHCKLNVNV